MGTHPIFESDFDCLTEEQCRKKSHLRRFRPMACIIHPNGDQKWATLINSTAVTHCETRQRKSDRAFWTCASNCLFRFGAWVARVNSRWVCDTRRRSLWWENTSRPPFTSSSLNVSLVLK